MRCAGTALSHAFPSRIKLQQHSHFVKLFLSIIMQFYAQVMCRIQIIQCNCSKIMSCASHHEEHKKSRKNLYTCVRIYVCLCCDVLCMTWFSYRQQLLLIQLKEVWPRAKGEICTERREEKGEAFHGRRPPPAVQDPTSAARPVLPNLKAVSAETEGAVSSHDAAIAAPELVAG